MGRLSKPAVAALVFALALASVLLVAPPAAAAQNRPTWSQGDFWVYARTAGGSTSTIRIDVLERSSLTLISGTYSVWHVTTTTTANGNATVRHSWIDDASLGIAKANFSTFIGDVQVTFDPPMRQAVFPLTVNAQWSLNTTVRIVGTSLSFPLGYSSTVIAEQSTTVAAGTFNVAVVRNPSTGATHDENSYSDGAGNNVKQEHYDSNGNRVVDQELTSYRYQAGTLGLLLIVGGVILVVAIAVAVVMLTRRRKARMPPPGMVPPQQPPQAPPSGP